MFDLRNRRKVTIAKNYSANVTAITISKKQFEYNLGKADVGKLIVCEVEMYRGTEPIGKAVRSMPVGPIEPATSFISANLSAHPLAISAAAKFIAVQTDKTAALSAINNTPNKTGFGTTQSNSLSNLQETFITTNTDDPNKLLFFNYSNNFFH